MIDYQSSYHEPESASIRSDIENVSVRNFPGSYHEKRYQDVEMLLAAGIDVYSTVNIQHLASLKDEIAQISGIQVKAQIPDRLLGEAWEIVAVDVTPETLLERLQAGKIYPLENIERALQTVFQRQNLVILREMALRQVANHVEAVRIREAYCLNHNQAIGFGSNCSVHERVLVCLSAKPDSIQLLKRGARLANGMNASLYGLFVGNPANVLTKEEILAINACERLCQDFRGEFLRIDGDDLPATISHIAKTYHITQVVLGKTHRSLWRSLFQSSYIDRLVRLLTNQADLHIVAKTDS
jgi:two-component system sensor histidine kinase KdpD